MNYVNSFDLFGVPAKQIPATPGSGAPTTTTEGAVGCLYMDTNTGNLYKCTAVADGVYTWVEAGNGSGDGLSDTAKTLLITILRNGIYSSDQSVNITALEVELGSSGGSGDNSGDSGESGGDDSGNTDTEVTLSSISAVYSGGDVPVGTAVTDLTGIVVTAYYSDGSTERVFGYYLSGTIAEGSNTIAVSYGGKTTTFTVTGVSEAGDDTAPHVWVDGYFAPGGNVAQYANYMYCEEYFPVDSGEHYDLYCPNTAWIPEETHICYYDANKQFISRAGTIKAKDVHTLPNGVGNYVCLVVPNQPTNACFIRVSTHDVSAYKNSLVITQEVPVPELPYADATWTEGFVMNEAIGQEAGCWVSSYVSVEPGATYRFGNSNAGWTTSWYGIGIYSALHNGFISRVDTAEFTVPENAKYVRLSAQNMTGYTETATLTKVS